MSLTVAAHEHGLVRVFALSMTDEDAQAFKDAKNPEILGLTNWETDFVEVFPVSDLEQLGIAGYLESGCGIEKSRIDPTRLALSQLDGWVMIVFSRAFDGQPATLVPSSSLTLIGTYAEPGVDWVDKIELTSDAATTPATRVKKKPSDAAMSGRIAMIALLVIFVLTAVMVWIAS